MVSMEMGEVNGDDDDPAAASWKPAKEIPQQLAAPDSKAAEAVVAPPAAPAPAPAPAGSVPFVKLFSFADAVDILLMGFGTLGAVVSGLATPFMTILFGQVIDAFGQNSGFNNDRVQKEVSKVSVRFLYLGAAAFVASFMQFAFWAMTGERQATRIRRLYLHAILRQDVAFFDRESTTGQVISRLSGDTVLIQDAISDKVGQFIHLVSTFVGGFIVAFIRGWQLTLVLLAMIPAIVAVGAAMSMVIVRTTSRGQRAYSQAGDVVEQAIGAIRTVAAFGAERKSMEDYRNMLKAAYKATVMEGLFYGLGMGSFMLIFFCSYALAIFYGSKLIINNGYTGGHVINVLIAVLIGSMSLGQTTPSINAFGSGRAAAFKMFEVIQRVPEIDVYDVRGDVLEAVKGDIEFRNVEFAYPARPEVRVFAGFSVHIRSGATTAFVGESGSGKSTIISLIERFYDPQGGEIKFDGIDIRKLQLKWLRQQMGLVGQEPVLFGTSIRENIAYGKEGATMPEIENAAMLANASTFISQLPAGYDTVVGDHGTKLSGGQKQRVAIARAILKNPCVLLLDEATSALDAESERQVQEALDRVMIGRTTVVVAHRLTTVRNADTIAVLERGFIVEQGKHEELLQGGAGGAYFQLVNLQQTQLRHGTDDGNASIRRNFSSDSVERYERRSSTEMRNGSSLRRSVSSKGSGRKSGSVRDAGAETEIWGEFSADTPKDAATAGRRGTWLVAAFHRWHAGKADGKVDDPESGDGNLVRDVSFFRLASLNKPEAPILAVGSAAAVFNGVVFPIYGLLLSSIIKTFYEPPHQLRKDADFWAVMFLVLGCVAFVALTIQKLCFNIGGGKLVERMRCLTFEKVLQQEISWFDDSRNSSGAVCARLSADAAQVKAVVGDTLSVIVQNIATIVAAFVIAFSANWILTFVVIALVPLIGLQGMMRIKLLTGFGADTKAKYENASQVATDAVGSIRTVASFGAEEKVMKIYDDRCRSPMREGLRQGVLNGSVLAMANLVMFCSFALCFWYGAKLVRDGKTDFQRVFRVIFAITMSTMTIARSVTLLPDLTKAKAAVNSVFAVLERRSRIDPYDTSGSAPASVNGSIEFSHVSFRYPTRPSVLVLKDFSLSVGAGKTVALVGESGCGKSTVISLLERFYDPEKGRICLDGTDIKRLQVRWLRQQMALVSQEPVLFNASIGENILYGLSAAVPGAAAAEELMVAAAKAANAHRFISELPQGYETCVGERGIQLSGGQKQRVAIARAMARAPKVLLLDEATSALDSESERVVQEALERAMEGRTVMVVAHRLSTIRGADLIAVVRDGRVAEQGRHETLRRGGGGGIYASLIKLHSEAAAAAPPPN